MMTLPLVVSVPHAGLDIPPEVANLCILSEEEISADGDQGAADIYDIENEVAGYVTTNIGRPFVDMNRAEDDFSKDGVVKTHTCFNIPVYNKSLEPEIVSALIKRYWKPYHQNLATFAPEAKIGLDLHTMVEYGPPVGPDHGQRRPFMCISNGAGETCPNEWAQALVELFRASFPGERITLNDPFSGGYICHQYSRSRPWLQVEFSRTSKISADQKRSGLLKALYSWVAAFC